MIQSLGGTKFPQAYEVAVRAENNLINFGKLLLRPLMRASPNISLQLQGEAIFNTFVQPQLMYVLLNAKKNNASLSPSMVVEINDMNDLL